MLSFQPQYLVGESERERYFNKQENPEQQYHVVQLGAGRAGKFGAVG